MSDPIIDRLDQIKDRADAATPGPWDLQPWSRFALPSGDYAESILLANASPDGELVRGLLDEDGEFIAAARTDVVQMEQALRGVLDVHRRVTDFYGPDDSCAKCSSFHWNVQWPCLTVRAIADALGVETEGEER